MKEKPSPGPPRESMLWRMHRLEIQSAFFARMISGRVGGEIAREALDYDLRPRDTVQPIFLRFRPRQPIWEDAAASAGAFDRAEGRT